VPAAYFLLFRFDKPAAAPTGKAGSNHSRESEATASATIASVY